MHGCIAEIYRTGRRGSALVGLNVHYVYICAIKGEEKRKRRKREQREGGKIIPDIRWCKGLRESVDYSMVRLCINTMSKLKHNSYCYNCAGQYLGKEYTKWVVSVAIFGINEIVLVLHTLLDHHVSLLNIHEIQRFVIKYFSPLVRHVSEHDSFPFVFLGDRAAGT
jgi:hypothetical protein